MTINAGYVLPNEELTDLQVDDIQRELGVGASVAEVRDLMQAMGSEGDAMNADSLRVLLTLWCDFNASYCASWMSPRGVIGNFAGWLINNRKVVA